ncbi:zinc-finger domain-containing protein [Halobacillus aidingensis]|uniref:zinc-finger domain-containing protein n=1 Tax=Halobacillus aidingensis TaxID=240303 RepID=UPI001428D85D|nr:zinc-finger domain-containing protein [Halobacillus aidingensis]
MLNQKVLKRITHLEKNHCKNCEKKKGKDSTALTRTCKACPIGQELLSLGSQLELNKVERVMAKGKDMTFSDIRFCFDSGVDPDEIKKAAGMSHGKTFKKYMNNHGYATSGRKLI